MYALDPLFRRFIKRGHLVLTDHRGRVHHYGDESAAVDAAIRIHTSQTAWRIARNPAYNIGAAYTEGDLTVEKGTLLGLAGLLLRNTALANTKPAIRFIYRLEELVTLPALLNWASRSRQNVAHHYDLSGALFALPIIPPKMDRARGLKAAEQSRPQT